MDEAEFDAIISRKDINKIREGKSNCFASRFVEISLIR